MYSDENSRGKENLSAKNMSCVVEKEHESHLSYKMSLAAKCVSLHCLAPVAGPRPHHNGRVSDIQFMIQNSFSGLIESHPILKIVQQERISFRGKRRRAIECYNLYVNNVGRR